MNEIYLDNSATTRPFKTITDKLGDIAYNYYANPSSLYDKGVEAEELIASSRKITADSLGCTSDEICFTSGGTESNNIAIQGFLDAHKRNEGTIVTTKIEHSSILNVFKDIEMGGRDVAYLDVDKNGIIDIQKFEEILKANKVIFVSIAHINNEVGSLQPLDEIIRLKKQYKFTLHIDAVQSYCKFDFKKYINDIDFLSASGHKIHGIKGTGILYIKKGNRVSALVKGGGQESAIRSGTENVIGIWAIGEAVRIIDKSLKQNCDKMRTLRDYLANELLKNVDGCAINGSIDVDKSSPYILNVSFKGIPGEVMLHSLEAKKIYVSTGSACSSKHKGPSHVLKNMGIDNNRAGSSIRISISIETTKEEIDECIKAIKEICQSWR